MLLPFSALLLLMMFFLLFYQYPYLIHMSFANTHTNTNKKNPIWCHHIMWKTQSLCVRRGKFSMPSNKQQKLIWISFCCVFFFLLFLRDFLLFPSNLSKKITLKITFMLDFDVAVVISVLPACHSSLVKKNKKEKKRKINTISNIF